MNNPNPSGDSLNPGSQAVPLSTGPEPLSQPVSQTLPEPEAPIQPEPQAQPLPVAETPNLSGPSGGLPPIPDTSETTVTTGDIPSKKDGLTTILIIMVIILTVLLGINIYLFLQPGMQKTDNNPEATGLPEQTSVAVVTDVISVLSPVPTTAVPAQTNHTLVPTAAGEELTRYVSQDLQIEFFVPKNVTVQEVATKIGPEGETGCAEPINNDVDYYPIRIVMNGKPILQIRVPNECSPLVSCGMAEHDCTDKYSYTYNGKKYTLTVDPNQENLEYFEAEVQFGSASKWAYPKTIANKALIYSLDLLGKQSDKNQYSFTEAEFQTAVRIIASIKAI